MATLRRMREADPVLLWGGSFAVLAFGFTLVNLGTRSFWWDELFTLFLSLPRTSTSDATMLIRGDVHPPLYFFGVRLWLSLLGVSSEFAARSFNLLPFAFGVWMGVRALRQRLAEPVTIWLVVFFRRSAFIGISKRRACTPS